MGAPPCAPTTLQRIEIPLSIFLVSLAFLNFELLTNQRPMRRSHWNTALSTTNVGSRVADSPKPDLNIMNFTDEKIWHLVFFSSGIVTVYEPILRQSPKGPR